MHTLVGNTAGKLSWYQQHKVNMCDTISCAIINVGGMQEATKRLQLKKLKHDIYIYAISETHLQQHLESAETLQFPSYFCVWGKNAPDRHFNGVAILANRAKFWAAQKLKWESTHPCYRFYQEGRLVACQLWMGRGGLTTTIYIYIYIYIIYGKSGARWERPKKQYFHELMQAIEQDRVERGPGPSILMGDFTLELNDSHCIRRYLHTQFWLDVRARANPSMQARPTCHKGRGSQIDHVFVTQSLYDHSSNFEVQKYPEFKDHSVVSVQFTVPKCSQMRTSLRAVEPFNNFEFPSSESNKLVCFISDRFHQAIQEKDVYEPLLLLGPCRLHSRVSVAESQGYAVSAPNFKRGDVKFTDSRMYPRIVNA